MPPKAKFTKEEIITAALGIVRESGFNALTARSLGERLGSSARPLFTVFKSMEEIQNETTDAAKELYDGYVRKGLSEKPAFKGVGTQYIKFAIDEPHLFSALFMKNRADTPEVGEVLPLIDDNFDEILRSITEGYGLNTAEALRLYRHLWIYTHGIAVLLITGLCSFSEDEISEMMTDVFVSLMKKIKGGS